jgi:hypothetical protein
MHLKKWRKKKDIIRKVKMMMRIQMSNRARRKGDPGENTLSIGKFVGFRYKLIIVCVQG